MKVTDHKFRYKRKFVYCCEIVESTVWQAVFVFTFWAFHLQTFYWCSLKCCNFVGFYMLYIKMGLEYDNYFNGDQITLLVRYILMAYLFQGLVAIGKKKWTWSPLTKQVYILITYVLLIPQEKICPGGS